MTVLCQDVGDGWCIRTLVTVVGASCVLGRLDGGWGRGRGVRRIGCRGRARGTGRGLHRRWWTR